MTELPKLIYSKTQLLKNYKLLTPNLSIKTAFTVSSSTNPEIPKLLRKIGLIDHFNCISKSQIKNLKKLLTTDMKTQVSFTNPLKIKPVLQLAYRAGIQKFSVKSVEDVVRISKSVGSGALIIVDSDEINCNQDLIEIFEKIEDEGMIFKGVCLNDDSDGKIDILRNVLKEETNNLEFTVFNTDTIFKIQECLQNLKIEFFLDITC